MKLPFTTEQFLEVFGKYNISVFPAQIVIYILAIIVVILAVFKKGGAGKFSSYVLAIFWFWMGMIYQVAFFSAINKAAYLFGLLFIVQATFFIYEGVIKKNLTFEYHKNFYSITGQVIIIYALFIYPIIGYYSGHVYPMAPTFGLPCPTVIFTFGILLLSVSRVRIYLLIIPFLWSLIGSTAALNLGIKEDTGLLAAGLITLMITTLHNANLNSIKTTSN